MAELKDVLHLAADADQRKDALLEELRVGARDAKERVERERAEREETLGANLSTEDRINALRQQGAGGGGGGGAGSGKARGSRGGSRRGPPP